MPRPTREMLEMINDPPLESRILCRSVDIVRTHEALLLIEAQANVIRSWVLPNGRRVRLYHYGFKNYLWIAGFYDGSETDEYPAAEAFSPAHTA